MESSKEEFVKRLQDTKRVGMENVIKSLEQLHFFESPASSNFHLNYKGGLMEHSLNVCDVALSLRDVMVAKDPTLEGALPKESVIIAALLHDVCKAGIYKESNKWRKDDQGRWESYLGYELDYSWFPMGHGEKSVIMLLKFGLDLKPDEMLAIRWHMHAWDLPFQSPDIKANLNAAKEKCPLLTIIQCADGLASSLLERKTDDKA